jgi:hypothetical protein
MTPCDCVLVSLTIRRAAMLPTFGLWEDESSVGLIVQNTAAKVQHETRNVRHEIAIFA